MKMILCIHLERFFFNGREWKGQFGPETRKKSSQINNEGVVVGFLLVCVIYLLVKDKKKSCRKKVQMKKN
jgi:hypothetical protein